MEIILSIEGKEKNPVLNLSIFYAKTDEDRIYDKPRVTRLQLDTLFSPINLIG